MRRRPIFSASSLVPFLALAVTTAFGAAAGCGSDSPAGGGGAGGESTGKTSSTHTSSSSSASSTHASTTTGTGGDETGGTTTTGATGGSGGGTGGGGGLPTCAPTELPVDPNGVPPALLSQSGLYVDLATNSFEPYVLAYAPEYPLWSDGATKNRFIYVPSGCKIDNSNPDLWIFPVGTRFWKEFRDPNSGLKLETRLIERFGPDDHDWSFNAYAWRMDQTEADLITDGLEHDDVLGTQHDIPAAPGQCLGCHHIAPDHTVLGFDSIQLNGAVPVTMKMLAGMGILTTPVAADHVVPGNATESAALGYLHGNCGQCHNEFNMPAGGSFHMRLRTADALPTDTDTYKTGVRVPTTNYHGHMGGGGGDPSHPIDTRIEPGDPDASCVYFRMSSRSGVNDTPDPDQMPPLATEMPDATELTTIRAWIQAIQ